MGSLSEKIFIHPQKSNMLKAVVLKVSITHNMHKYLKKVGELINLILSYILLLLTQKKPISQTALVIKHTIRVMLDLLKPKVALPFVKASS